jgi:hypothetical protein
MTGKRKRGKVQERMIDDNGVGDKFVSCCGEDRLGKIGKPGQNSRFLAFPG